MRQYDGKNKQQIEKGLRLFHGFPMDGDMIWLYKEGYPKDEAYLWCYPSGCLLTYGDGLNHLDGSEPNMKAFESLCDHEFALDLRDFKPYVNEDYSYRILSKKDDALMDEFLSQCSEEDKSVGQVSIEDDKVMGAFDDEKLVAVASTWDLKEQLSDIGVLVHPTYKKCGLGTSVVSKLIDEIKETRLPIYRADYDNPASEKIALKLGFSVITTVHRYKK